MVVNAFESKVGKFTPNQDSVSFGN